MQFEICRFYMIKHCLYSLVHSIVVKDEAVQIHDALGLGNPVMQLMSPRSHLGILVSPKQVAYSLKAYLNSSFSFFYFESKLINMLDGVTQYKTSFIPPSLRSLAQNPFIWHQWEVYSNDAHGSKSWSRPLTQRVLRRIDHDVSDWSQTIHEKRYIENSKNSEKITTNLKKL